MGYERHVMSTFSIYYENGNSKFFRNVDTYLLDYLDSRLRSLC